MTRNPRERNSGSPYRGRRLRADEVRRARQSRAAPVSGRPVQAQKYQPRLSDEFPAVPEEKPKKKGWTPFRLGLLAVSLSLLLLASIFVVPVLIQMQRTADNVLNQDDPDIEIAENPDGTPVIVTPESENGDDGPGFADDEEGEDPPDDGDDLPDWDGDDRINIALYGVDSREEGDVARSDTIIIVSIDPATNEVGMMSIPRDLQVEIPDIGTEKINAAYAHGGRALAKAVIEYNFEIDIHYYAEVDFVGFINIVDTIGGVVVDNDAVIKDDEYEWTRAYFPTGPQHLTGEEALRYVRTRKDDNDFARGQRQQQVLRALRAQGVRLDLITRARSLLEDVEENFRTDLSMRESLALARMANNVDSENIQSHNLVECTSDTYEGGVYYLLPDWECIGELTDEMMPSDESAPPDAADESGEEDPDVNYSMPILIENATFVNQLAGQTSDYLGEAGYSNIDVAQADNAGNQPVSEIYAYGGNEQTAQDLADQLGLDPNAVIMENGEHPSGYEFVVILGDDAPDPGAS